MAKFKHTISWILTWSCSHCDSLWRLATISSLTPSDRTSPSRFSDTADFGARTLFTSQATLLVDTVGLVIVFEPTGLDLMTSFIGTFDSLTFLDDTTDFLISAVLTSLVSAFSGFTAGLTEDLGKRDGNCVSLVFKPCSNIWPTRSDSQIILGFSTGLTSLRSCTGFVFSDLLTDTGTGCLDFSNKLTGLLRSCLGFCSRLTGCGISTGKTCPGNSNDLMCLAEAIVAGYLYRCSCGSGFLMDDTGEMCVETTRKHCRTSVWLTRLYTYNKEAVIKTRDIQY